MNATQHIHELAEERNDLQVEVYTLNVRVMHLEAENAGLRHELGRARRELDTLRAAARTLVQNARPMLDTLDKASDRGYQACVEASRAPDDDQPAPYRKSGPFASLRDMRHTECPCGCGASEVCEAQRARVKEHNDAIPF